MSHSHIPVPMTHDSCKWSDRGGKASAECITLSLIRSIIMHVITFDHGSSIFPIVTDYCKCHCVVTVVGNPAALTAQCSRLTRHRWLKNRAVYSL